MLPALIDGLAPPESASDPSWLPGLRAQAVDWIRANGFPTRRHEDWRYTRIDSILATHFEPASAAEGGGLDTAWLDGHVADLGGPRLVFVDGRFVPGASRVPDLLPGVTLRSIHDVLDQQPELLEAQWAAIAAQPDHAFAALNVALASDGAFVELAADTVLTEPIQLVFVSGARTEPTVASPFTSIRLGRGAQATLVEAHVHVGAVALSVPHLHNSITDVGLADDATLHHFVTQNAHVDSFHLDRLSVEAGPRSRFTSKLVSLGGAIARREVHVRLAGDGSTVELDGLYLPGAGQQHDHPILIEHLASDAVSRQLYKGIIDGDGHGVFNGRVIVHPDLRGTDAEQSNRNLLLSDRAEADTRPRLEIYSEDVRATHGAAVGQLDEDQLFYLRSRGIPHTEARMLLTQAFATELVDRIDLPALRDHVEHLVSTHLVAEMRSGSAS